MELLLAQETSQTSPGFAGFLPIIVIVFIFYFLLWRPQAKQKKAHAAQLAALKKGDRVVTRGGIYGKIVDFQGKNENKVLIDVGGNNRITISRPYIAGLGENTPEPSDN